MEPFPLDRSIGAERHVHPVATSDDVVGNAAAAELAKSRTECVVAVIDLDMVVGALHVCFQFKLVKDLQQTVFCD